MSSQPSTVSTSPPPLSLLSLSDAAASARHIPVPPPAPIPIKQRHRSSFSQSRKRRPSDARDPLLTHSGALLLSRDEDRDRAASKALSLSPPGVSTTGAISKSAPLDGDSAAPRNTSKKGTVFRCETCSKVYRHPSCLVKHRWEHSPHWREASKFLLSKHQQVQLLEAAAILSHLSPTGHGGGTSLPEDRSLWPSYLSGGLLPLPRGPETAAATITDAAAAASDTPDVPALTTFRPGLLGHPNPTPSSHPLPTTSLQQQGSMPVAVPPPRWAWRGGPGSIESGSADSSSWKEGGASPWTHTPYTSTSGPFSVSSERISSEHGLSVSSEHEERGWSLPKSSVRHGSGDSDEEAEDEEDAVKEEEWDGMDMEMDL